MNIRYGIENECFKYVYGIRNPYGLPFDERKEISLTCGRNDWAAVQLLLYSENEMLVCVNEDTCFYERGPIDIVRIKTEVPGLDSGAVNMKLVGLIEDDDRQLKSDLLLDQPFIYVEARKVQAVWVEVKIGRDVKPGIYEAHITISGHRMFEDEEILGEQSFKIKVADLLLDSPAQYSFYLDLWQHNSNIARKYEVPLWSEKHFEIIERYVEALAALGQKAITVIASEIPWSGQFSSYDRVNPSNTFEYSTVRVALSAEGKWKYDFSPLNRYVRLCMEYGIDSEIEVFGLINIWLLEDVGFGSVIEDYPDGIRIRYLDEKTGTYKYIRRKSDLQSYITALEANFTENGWIDKVRVVADEPADVALFTERLNALKAMAPSFRFKAAINHASFIEEDIDGIDDYVPILPSACREYDRIQELRSSIRGRLLFYVCCWPDKPNTFICSPLIESRMIPWLAWYLDLDGFLRWNFTVWPDDPRNRISYRYPEWKAGDTNFVYPGKDGKPLLTLRYKNLKRGIRDYELMRKFGERHEGRVELEGRLKSVFYWKDPGEIHPDSGKKREELYSVSYESYENIINGIILEMSESND